MNNNSIIKSIKYLEIAIVICAVVICAYVAIFSGNMTNRIVAIGAAVGAVIGSIIDLKILIPRKCKDKDERTIMVMLLSLIFANSLCFLITFVIFAFTVFGSIELMNYSIFTIFTIAIAVLYFVIEKIAYRILNNNI